MSARGSARGSAARERPAARNLRDQVRAPRAPRERELHRRRPARWPDAARLLRLAGARRRARAGGRHRFFLGNGCQARTRVLALPDARPAPARRRCGIGQGCGDHAPALRPRRQFRAVSRGDAAPAGPGDAIRDRAPHARRALPRRLRGRGRRRHGAARLRRASPVPRRRRRALSRNLAAPDRRPYHGPAGGAGVDPARLGRAGLGRQPFLRQHGAAATLSHRLVGRRHGRRLPQAAGAGRVARAHHPGPRPAGHRALFRAVGRSAGRRGAAGLKTARRGFVDTREALGASSSPLRGGEHAQDLCSDRVRHRRGILRHGGRAAAGGTGGREELQIPIHLAGEPDAAGQLQDVRRACRQAHRRASEDRGAPRRFDRAAVRDPRRHAQEGDRRRPRRRLLLGRQEQGGEIVPSAQRGVIDCAEWVGGIEDLRLGLPQVWKYHYTPAMHENNSFLELIMNGDVWKGLSAQQQEAVRAAVFDTFVRWGIRWQKQNADAIEEMRTKYGTVILRTPPAILVDFLKTWDTIAAEESAKNPFFKKVYDSQREYAAKVVPAKRFMFPPYSFAANYYFPEKKPAAKAKAQ